MHKPERLIYKNENQFAVPGLENGETLASAASDYATARAAGTEKTPRCVQRGTGMLPNISAEFRRISAPGPPSGFGTPRRRAQALDPHVR